MPGQNQFSHRRFLTHTSATAAVTGITARAPTEHPVPKSVGCWEKPTDQRGKSNRQDLIFLNIGTFRADNLEAYGWVGGVRAKDWQSSKIIDREKLGCDCTTKLYDRNDDPDKLTLATKTETYLESAVEITKGQYRAEEDFDSGDPAA